MPERGRNRQGLAAPLIEPGNAIAFADVENQGLFGDRLRQDLQRHFGQHAERAEAAGHQPRNIVAGDVLHDLAAEIEHLASAVDQLDAQHEVTHRPRLLPARPGKPGGDAAANRRTGKTRRLEGQHLAFFGQRRLDLGERRAAFGGDVKLGRLVGNDAVVARHIKQFTGQHAAVEILAAGAADAQRRVAVVG